MRNDDILERRTGICNSVFSRFVKHISMVLHFIGHGPLSERIAWKVKPSCFQGGEGKSIRSRYALADVRDRESCSDILEVSIALA